MGNRPAANTGSRFQASQTRALQYISCGPKKCLGCDRTSRARCFRPHPQGSWPDRVLHQSHRCGLGVLPGLQSWMFGLGRPGGKEGVRSTPLHGTIRPNKPIPPAIRRICPLEPLTMPWTLLGTFSPSRHALQAFDLGRQLQSPMSVSQAYSPIDTRGPV